VSQLSTVDEPRNANTAVLLAGSQATATRVSYAAFTVREPGAMVPSPFCSACGLV